MMTNPYKPIIDPRTAPRTKEAGDETSPANGTTPPVTPDNVVRREDVYKTPPSDAPTGESSTSTTKVTAAPISASVPSAYTASSYAELIPQLEKRMAEYKPLSEEELKKLRRRQKAEGIISGLSDAVQSVANLVFTSKYAPNMYDPKEGMSAKAKERFEKDKAQREAEADKYLNYALTIGKMRDSDKERGLRVWQTEQDLARQDRAFDAGRKDRADDVEFRNKDYDERLRQWKENFDRQGEWHKEEGERWEKEFKAAADRWEKEFTQSVHQFNVTSALERRRINIAAQQAAHDMKQGQMTFNLGSGNGNVTLSLDKLNAQTVSRIYSTLPASARQQVHGDPIVQNGLVVGYKQPTTEAMLIAIGANVESSPATQKAIRQVAGLEKGNKPKLY